MNNLNKCIPILSHIQVGLRGSEVERQSRPAFFRRPALDL